MSAAAVIPPPNSTSVMRHVPRLTVRARALLTAMNLHFAGVAALSVVLLYLIVHVIFVANALKASNADALDQQKVMLKSAEISARPLRGLDTKLAKSTNDADAFYADRLTYAYSPVLTELGVLTKRSGVRLGRVQYSQSPALAGSYALTEVHMDASISGDYRPTVQFINSIERDKMFFVINGINLTGQQTGQVNLRLRMTTYLRAPNDSESVNATQTGVTDTGEADAAAADDAGAKP